MADYDNTNSGVLFRNERKERDNQPDYTGKVNVEGHTYMLAAWIKQGRNGKFMSLKLSEPKAQDTVKRGAKAEYDDESTDIPF